MEPNSHSRGAKRQFTCVYCLQQKPRAQFNREHVIPIAFGTFGNNLSLTNEVCHECNDYFGSTLDLVLARGSPSGVIRYLTHSKPLVDLNKVDPARITVRILDDNGEASDEVTFFETADGEGVKRTCGIWYWTTTESRRFVSLSELESNKKGLLDDLDGRQLVVFIRSGQEELDRLKAALLHLKKGITIESEIIEQEQLGERLPVAFDVVEDDTTRRAIAKIAFNYLTKIQGSHFTLNEGFNPIREYIRNGKHLEQTFVQRTRNQPFYEGEREARERGGHTLLITMAPSGTRILGYVGLFYGISNLAYEVSFGRYTGVLPANLAAGHYFDVRNKRIEEVAATTRPPGLWVPQH